MGHFEINISDFNPLYYDLVYENFNWDSSPACAGGYQLRKVDSYSVESTKQNSC